MKYYIDVKDLKKFYYNLSINDQVFLTGKVYAARDAAHRRLEKLILNDEELPINIKDSVIYYTGPTPAKPGMVIGSCGPTSSYRMNKYLEPLLKLGLVGIIGKGDINKEAKNLIKKYRAIYFTAIGGAGALACKYVKSMKEIAFLDLRCESIKEFYIENFPLFISQI